jgi:hypothetical protein
VLTVHIFDLEGRSFFEHYVYGREISLPIDLVSLREGLYVVQLVLGRETRNMKVVKGR